MPETATAATDLDLISFFKAIPDARKRFARRHHGVLTETLGIELKRPPSDSAFRYFFLQMDVASIYSAFRD